MRLLNGKTNFWIRKRNVYSKNFRDFCDFRLQIGAKDVKMVQFDSLKVTLGHYLLRNTFCFSWISSSVAFLTKFRCIVVLIIPINWVPRHAQASSFALTAVTRLFEFSIYGNILEMEIRGRSKDVKINILTKNPLRPIETVWTVHFEYDLRKLTGLWTLLRRHSVKCFQFYLRVRLPRVHGGHLHLNKNLEKSFVSDMMLPDKKNFWSRFLKH